jgi:hypothetical protein
MCSLVYWELAQQCSFDDPTGLLIGSTTFVRTPLWEFNLFNVALLTFGVTNTTIWNDEEWVCSVFTSAKAPFRYESEVINVAKA